MAGSADVPIPASLHARILAELETQILSGRWPPGHRVPSEHDLAARYGCARMTVNKAMAQLARAGLIERRRRAGSFVRLPQAQSAVLTVADVRAEVAGQGLAYRYERLSLQRRQARAGDRRDLGLAGSGPVLAVACRHFAGARVFCLETRLISLDAVPAAAAEPFETVAPGAWLLAHIPWTAAEHRIRAVAADAATAGRMAVPRGTACLAVERRTASGDLPVTFARLLYPGHAHELVARFTPAFAAGPPGR